MRGCVAARQAEGTGALLKEALAARQGSNALQCCSPMACSLTATHAGASHTSHPSRTAPLSRGQQGSPVLMALQGRHRLTLVLLKSRLGYRKGRTWICKQGHLYHRCEASSGMVESQMALDLDHAVL